MSSNPQTPSKGRIVLFRANTIGAEEWPAIVTKVHSTDRVDLHAFGGPAGATPGMPGGLFFAITYKDIDDAMGPGDLAWRWPPRV